MSLDDFRVLIDADSRDGAGGMVGVEVVGDRVELAIFAPGASGPAARQALSIADAGMLFDTIADAIRVILARQGHPAAVLADAIRDTPQNATAGVVSVLPGKV